LLLSEKHFSRLAQDKKLPSRPNLLRLKPFLPKPPKKSENLLKASIRKRLLPLRQKSPLPSIPKELLPSKLNLRLPKKLPLLEKHSSKLQYTRRPLLKLNLMLLKPDYRKPQLKFKK